MSRQSTAAILQVSLRACHPEHTSSEARGALGVERGIVLLAPPSLVRSLVGTLPRFASQATQSTLRIGDAGQQTGMLPWKLTNSMRVKPAMCYRYHRSCKHYVVSSKRKKAGGNVQGSLEGSSISSHVPWPMSTSSSQAFEGSGRGHKTRCRPLRTALWQSDRQVVHMRHVVLSRHNVAATELFQGNFVHYRAPHHNVKAHAFAQPNY